MTGQCTLPASVRESRAAQTLVSGARFRDRARAEQALGRYRALAPAGPEAVGAERLLDAIQHGE
jgi:hypothetical protein